MAENLKIVIDVDVKDAGDIKSLKGDLSDLGKAGKSAAPGLDAAGKASVGMSGAIKGLVAGGILAAAGQQLIAFGKASIEAASNAQEMQSKFNIVFGDLAGKVTNDLTAFADAANRSQYDLMGYAATLQDTLKPMGIAPDLAADLSTQLVKLGTDLSSFNNMSMDEALQRLQGTLIGSHENALAFGVVINENTLKAELAAQGWDKLTGAQLEAAKVQARINLLMAGTSDAQGDAIRTADSYANQVKGMQAAMSDLQVTVGTALLPVMTDLVGLVTEAVDRLDVAAGAAGKYGDEVSEIISGNIESAKSFEELVNEARKIDEVRGIMGGLGTVVTGTTGAIRDGMGSITPELARAAGSFEEFQSVMNGLSRASQQDMKNFIFAQGLTIEQFYEQEKSAMAAEEALRQISVAAEDADKILQNYTDNVRLNNVEMENAIAATVGADAAMLQLVSTYELSSDAVGTLSEKQAEAAASAEILRGTTEREAEQFDRLQASGYLAANGITAIVGAADSATAAVDRSSLALEKLLGYMGSLDGRSVSANVTVNIDEVGSGPGVGNSGASGAGKGNSGKSGQDGSYSGGKGYDPPGYASGTDGWQTVPGPMGTPYPVTLHGGEAFNVVPVGGGSPTTNNSNSVNVVQNIYGGGMEAAAQARDGVKEALASAGIKGF